MNQVSPINSNEQSLQTENISSVCRVVEANANTFHNIPENNFA